MTAEARHVTLIEVAPRDGLQNEKTMVSTADKIALVERAVTAGFRHVEAVSFANPKRVPQMADAEAVMAGLAGRFPGVNLIGLALNARGAERAVAARCTQINYVVVASETFAARNQNSSVEDLVAGTREVAAIARAAGLPLSVSIATAFGCPFDGEVAPERVIAITEALLASDPVEIGFADTIGCAVPTQVTDMLARARVLASEVKWRCHFHDTRNTGLSNAIAAVLAGVDFLDASTGGIGGCPFAPAATGNVAAEDLVYAFHRMGIATGLDLDALIDTNRWLAGVLGKPVPAALGRAGPFPPKAV
ncbi:hydroxymethylglutaryl-CoA lyase [Phreatobacter sp.]|uniref:hydroxymethylglutaryl-CoA lyase n=1 Tax=Phreatobacter sp. TaxID=1966341 RepID=UPI003F6F13FA